jgi:hypothetical protein
MPKEVKVLAARRVYEFRPDDLRLTVLSTPAIRAKIQSEFAFQQAVMGAALPLFGAIDVSGQGLTFASGSISEEDGQITPIRFLQIEPTRIVIDIAAPSKGIDTIYRRLVHAVGNARVPDGSSAFGKPTQHSDYSELSARLDFPISAIAADGLPGVLQGVVGTKSEIAMTLYIQTLAPGEPYPGFPTQEMAILRVAPRQGFPLAERVYFSSAPVETDRHLKYLTELESTLRRTPSKVARAVINPRKRPA